MFGADLIIRTKLIPPRPRRRVLARDHLTTRLQEALDRRLTIVQAGTGYGKSTALTTSLARLPQPAFWYTITEQDTEPLLFLLHLIYAFRTRDEHLGERSLALLQGVGANALHEPVIDALVNDLAAGLPGDNDAFLILDDYHLVSATFTITALTDRLIEYAPPALHVVLSTRHRPDLPGLVRWQARGEVLELGREDLAFRPAEIAALFQLHGYGLSAAQIEALAEETEGWAIALQLIGQGVRAAGGVDEVLAGLPDSLEALFDYLAQEVLAKEPAERRAFLLATSILRHLTPAACEALTGRADSRNLLQALEDQGLFVVAVGDEYRYHRLFGDFLHGQLPLADAQALHCQAARFYHSQGDREEAIHHLLLAGELDAAGVAIAEVGEGLVRAGRLATLSAWIDRLPVDTLVATPALLRFQGDICRLSSRFDEALAWYEQARRQYAARRDRAGMSRALRGQASIHLDTVRPAQAESLLQEALRLIDGQEDRAERARLLDLLAENKLNQGQWEEAERLRQQAQALREQGPGEADLDVRVLLRTGRLDEARDVLERRAEEERQAPEPRPPRFHRETLLVLSLVHAFQGQAEAAFRRAQEGLAVGRRLASPFVEAVGYMRLGHAWQLLDRPGSRAEARTCYERAIALGEEHALPRIKVEALWGLCLLHGFSGDVATAESCAAEGLRQAESAGDEWIVALIRTSLGGGYVLAGRDDEAGDALVPAALSFRDCGDPYGQAQARLWLALLAHRQGAWARFDQQVSALLDLCAAHGYDYLFTQRTLIGPPDPQVARPLLLTARCRGLVPLRGRGGAYLARLLDDLGLTGLDDHPGYTLRVQTLGRLRVWRGDEELAAREWRRERSRRLFELLVTERGRFLHREQITEILWPDDDPDAAEGNFKVALNALNRALEPDRPTRAPSFVVARRESAYGLNPAAAVRVDADEFQRLVTAGDQAAGEEAISCYRQALALYTGDYLEDCLYQHWCSEERERLLTLYLSAAHRLAEALAARGDYAESIAICQHILARDRCWEPAYRLLMTCHAQQGNRALALRAYERCVQSLREDLDVDPLPQTTALHERISLGDLA